jgi:hypothetical protein
VTIRLDWHDGHVAGVAVPSDVDAGTELNRFIGPPKAGFGEGWRPGWPQGSGKRCEASSIRWRPPIPQEIREIADSCIVDVTVPH